VINDLGQVHPATRDRVNAAIKSLGYRGNIAARTLATGRSHTMGVVSFDTTLYGPASTLLGIEAAAKDAGYFVSIASIHWLNKASVNDAVDRLIAQAVEGIMVIGPTSSAAAAIRSLPDNLPVVLLHGGPRHGIPIVAIDHERGAGLATEHLLALGHRTVWHVSGPRGWAESRLRERGWRRALEAAGAPVPPVVSGDWSAQSGYAAGLQLAKDRDATAVFTGNDQMALGALRAMYEAGRRVPADVSIVGFDDIPEAAYLTPPLTTIRQDFRAVGRASLTLLLDQIALGRRGAEKLVIQPEVVVRQSTTRRA
jgi:DNA-binding LacI/PurR family transcriptional regulator